MNKFLKDIDRVYQTKEFKLIYKYLLSSFTIIIYIIIPFFEKRTIIVSFWFDFFVRIWIALSYCYAYCLLSDIDRIYSSFYKNAPVIENQKPDALKQILNIIFALSAGYGGYIFNIWAIGFFIPTLGKTGLIIALILAVLISFPLLSQYKKR